MNWEDLKTNKSTYKLLFHYQRLGQFRKNHPAIGAGKHIMISQNPYVFNRCYTSDKIIDDVLVGLDLPIGEKEISVGEFYGNGTKVRDFYSGLESIVENGTIKINTEYTILLIEKI